jgi:hypothetical protein
MWINQANADFVDCRTCHLTQDPSSTVPDFFAYYNNPNHHSVGVAYPTGAPANRYNTPNAQVGNTGFFDTNANGLLDPTELQLFITGSIAKVECSSCHIEHGAVTPAPGTPPSLHLRISNINSSLCYVCHKL